MANQTYKAAQIGIELLALDKEKCVEKVRENYEIFGPALMEFAQAAEDAKALLDVITSAEARLTVALSIVEPDCD